MQTLRIKQAYRGGDSAGKAGWWLHFEYNEAGVEALKAAIPHNMRSWDKENERWWVHELFEHQLLKVAPGLAAFKQQTALF